MLSLFPDEEIKTTEISSLNDKICSVCLEEIMQEDICHLNCGHEFCRSCLDTLFTMNKIDCPLCRRDIKSFTYRGQMNRIVVIKQGPRQVRRRQVVYINRTSVYMTIMAVGSTIGFTGSMILSIYLYMNGWSSYSMIFFIVNLIWTLPDPLGTRQVRNPPFGLFIILP